MKLIIKNDYEAMCQWAAEHIADAIRGKTGKTDGLTLDQMPGEIAGIQAGGGASENLPDGYTRLEYIESSGTQWIDTGIKPTVNMEYILDFHAFGQSTAYTSPFGFRDSANKSAIGFTCNAYSEKKSLNYYYRFGNSSERQGTYPHNQRWVLIMNKGGAPINHPWPSDAISVTGTTFEELNIGVHLFGSYALSSGTMERFIHMKCYRFTVKESGEIICDLIPVMRNEDNVLGMYDIVRHVFLTNVGSGVFAGGEME